MLYLSIIAMSGKAFAANLYGSFEAYHGGVRNDNIFSDLPIKNIKFYVEDKTYYLGSNIKVTFEFAPQPGSGGGYSDIAINRIYDQRDPEVFVKALDPNGNVVAQVQTYAHSIGFPDPYKNEYNLYIPPYSQSGPYTIMLESKRTADPVWGPSATYIYKIPNVTFSKKNTLPTARSASGEGFQNTPLNIRLRGSDSDGDPLTYSIVNPPNATHGKVSVQGNQAIFEPILNWHGTTTFTYRAFDGFGYSSEAVVTIVVIETNKAPVASNTSIMTSEDNNSNVHLLASDADGDALTYSLVTQPNAAHGTVTISGNVATFTPKPNWNGTTSFTYLANDGTVNSNTATVTVTVTPVNDPPSVSNATLALDEDTVGTLTLGVTDVDLQFEGDSHTWSIVTAPNAAHGAAVISGNKLTFTPVNDWNGTTTLTYRARDSKGVNSNTATITITVRPVNDAPVASNRTLTVAEDTAGTVTLLATDVDGNALTYSVVTQPNTAHGTVSISGNVATFTPKPNWNGTTSFTYRANDGTVNSNTATVTVTVTPVNDPPSVSNAALALDEDTVGTLTLGVTDVDLQFEGDSHTWSIVTAPNAAHGTASIAGNKLTFTPVKDWNGTTTLTYRARDSKGANSNTATITITVRPVNDAPVASNRTLTVAEDTAGTVTLVATDVDGDSLTYSLVTAPNSAHGTVTISGNVATFTPRPNWNGTTSFTYRANDGTVNSNTATVTVTVTPVNDAPVGMTPLTIRTIEGRTVEVKVTVLPN